MVPRRAAMLVCVVTRAPPACSNGSSWAVSAKWGLHLSRDERDHLFRLAGPWRSH